MVIIVAFHCTWGFGYPCTNQLSKVRIWFSVMAMGTVP
jgi:hypothetical protein